LGEEGYFMHILVVEDEKKVASFIKKGLEEEHYSVDLAYDGDEGLYKLAINRYDLIILDIMLPNKDGLEVIKEIRSKKNTTPVIMLTAKDSLENKIEGLDSGADDYLTKPFAFSELIARIRAILRRDSLEKSNILKFHDLQLDLITHKVYRAGEEIELTNKEYSLLEYFMRNPNKILTRTMISESVWTYDFDTYTNVIDVYINFLRNKIDKKGFSKLIHTVRGAGYILKVDGNA
jgi:heavy metal response regulator